LNLFDLEAALHSTSKPFVHLGHKKGLSGRFHSISVLAPNVCARTRGDARSRIRQPARPKWFVKKSPKMQPNAYFATNTYYLAYPGKK
jgi:hypothetical protein